MDGDTDRAFDGLPDGDGQTIGYRGWILKEEEYRLFFRSGKLLLADTYHEVECIERDFSQFEFLGGQIDSPFFSVDVARRDTGELVVIELGDGGVSGMPPLMHPIVFYEAFWEVLEQGGERQSP